MGETGFSKEKNERKMKKIEGFYQKYRNYMENSLFVIVLAFYPLTKINQGLDVVDTSYSLANFQYFPDMNGTWMVATYLANVVGHWLMGLPNGDALTGIYFYTGLLVSALALLVYFVLRKKMPAWLVFLGEMTAIGMCWCPTVILYNYLTYALMTVGVLLLCYGICLTDNQEGVFWGKRKAVLLTAGICLGANVAVRMPNVAQAAFILVLWYGAWLYRMKWSAVLQDTLICLSGYLLGFGVPFAAICVRYGVTAYPDMVYTMFAMTDKAKDYKPTSMLTGIFGEYMTGLYWLLFAGVCLLFLYLVYGLFMRLRRKKMGERAECAVIKWGYSLLCTAVFVVLIRFYWGRGAFDFRYYHYGSVYFWAVLFLLGTIVCALWVLGRRGESRRAKVFAAAILLLVFLTSLGSNNGVYPSMNNLFLAAPFTLWTVWRWFGKTQGKELHTPWRVMLLVFGVMVLVQSIGFHKEFVFLDGVWGEKRDTLAENIPKADNIYTNKENAELLKDLTDYAKEQEFAGRKVLLYGEIPGLAYFLDMPSAISTFWPDLDSYRMMEFTTDMAQVTEQMEEEGKRPVVIVAAGVAAYLSEDAEVYELFGVEPAVYAEDEKLAFLSAFLQQYDYEETFSNMRYVVYE